ncbi:hypothetical protein BVC93_24985 [Mycobacterium sp. MS1601]|uniref:hypothetical protein n=1 Tax=Mycobacterium sp. MS1601 TaxID=1936029 RepID=UPI0009790546|nr:hypothetical protein [Mycobacterium sp. MS1601]AQA05119.1 hypothetical protein BVC93_24985 [Mycobacterium sp. MS1601]
MPSNTVKTGAALGFLYVARRYYRNWGTTKEECSETLPGDDLVEAPAVQTTEGIWIDAPAADVWPWLIQMGQDRGGLYSYEKLENLAGLQYHNTDVVHQEWQHLLPGDVVRLAPQRWLGLRDGLVLEVAKVVEGQSIVLRATPARQHWNAVWSFHVLPRWDDRCRLLIRSRTGLRHPGEVLATEIAGPALAIITRGMLLGIKRRVENLAQADAAAAAASGDGQRVR